MTRTQLEHIIRAAAGITDETDFIIVGSQSVLGQYPNPPKECLISREADIYPRHTPDRADMIDSTIGEDSPFDRTFGYYAHGVGPETSILPRGWEDRLVLVSNANTLGHRGWCLEVHDLVIAKLAAGRDKDLDFARALARAGLIRQPVLLERWAGTPIGDPLRSIVRERIGSLPFLGFTFQ